MSRRSVGRMIAQQIQVRDRHRTNYRKIQKEAADRPESTQVKTPFGEVWMSPIELKLYEEMRREGLSPEPQLCIKGYFVDFAFADVKVAVEADGAAFHRGDRRERDRERDKVLHRAGWTVQHYDGAVIQKRLGNCVYFVKKEVEHRRKREEERARQEERKRHARNEAIARPVRRIARLLKSKEKRRRV